MFRAAVKGGVVPIGANLQAIVYVSNRYSIRSSREPFAPHTTVPRATGAPRLRAAAVAGAADQKTHQWGPTGLDARAGSCPAHLRPERLPASPGQQHCPHRGGHLFRQRPGHEHHPAGCRHRGRTGRPHGGTRSNCVIRLHTRSTCLRARYRRTPSVAGQPCAARVGITSHQPARTRAAAVRFRPRFLAAARVRCCALATLSGGSVLATSRTALRCPRSRP